MSDLNTPEVPTLPRIEEPTGDSQQLQHMPAVDVQPLPDPSATKPTEGLSDKTKPVDIVSQDTSASINTQMEMGTKPNPVTSPTEDLNPPTDTAKLGETPVDLANADPGTISRVARIRAAFSNLLGNKKN